MDHFDRIAAERAHSILVADARSPGSQESKNVHSAWKVISGLANLLHARPWSKPVSDGAEIAPEGSVKSQTPNPIAEGQRAGESKPSYCAEKDALRKAFVEAVQEMMLLQHQQVAALLEDDPDFMRFDLLLHIAAEQKQQAKYAFVHHIERHGC